jgi:hypothetical protein
VYTDRLDSFGNALLAFIALNPRRFQEVAEYLVAQQEPDIRTSLLECLQQLSSARDVKLDDVSKANRLKFVLNFRDFCVRVKSLALK